MTDIFNCAVLLNAFSSDADHADFYIHSRFFRCRTSTAVYRSAFRRKLKAPQNPQTTMRGYTKERKRDNNIMAHRRQDVDGKEGWRICRTKWRPVFNATDHWASASRYNIYIARSTLQKPTTAAVFETSSWCCLLRCIAVLARTLGAIANLLNTRSIKSKLSSSSSSHYEDIL